MSPRRADRRSFRRARRAMTLVELIVSLAIVTMILAACGSMVMVAGKALSNDASNPGSDAVAARAAVSMIVDDLKVATAVTEQSATAITMKVPDRDGDGAEESIRYAWSGTPGDPLTRTYNARGAGVVATNVRALNLGYLGKTVGKPPPVEGAEQAHNTHAAASSLANEKLSTTEWSGAYFKPALPANAVSWKVSRVRVQVKKTGLSLGNLVASVRYANAGGMPTGSDLASGSTAILNVGDGTLSWLDVSFPTPVSMDTGKTICVMVRTNALLEIGAASVHSANADASVAYLRSTDTGSTWSVTPGKALQLVIYGTVTTQDADTYAFQPLPAALQ